MEKILKKWRKINTQARLNIPTKYFNIDKNTIDSIRKIKDSKKRLIESARVQYELFKDIHSDLTAWIAGYSSESIVRRKFGSSIRLREIFIKPQKLDNRITPSWMDIKRNIRIPKEIDEKLAEEIGIHIGDGNLYINTHKDGSKSYKYTISGNLTNEYNYHVEHINKLMNDLYNLRGIFSIRKDRNSIDSIYKSKAIVEFKNKILNLSIGPKVNIKIPKGIFKEKEFERKCISGIIDTDFNLTNSLAITGKLTSMFVVKDMCDILKRNKIPYICRREKNYGRFYIRQKGAIKIIEEWGLNNQKHTSKYLIWKEFKKFIPFTTTIERLAVLNGKLDIEDLERISKKRKPQ
jgi:hypothetical protein